MNKTFFDVGHYQVMKEGENAPGDAFLSRKAKERQRVISVLSDGLGSGIRANVLSSLTATMALKSVENNLSVQKTAQLISKTLPVCSIRKISYATFTIVDIDEQGIVQILEYDNPPFILIRENRIIEPQDLTLTFSPENVKRDKIHCCNFKANPQDRIIFFSDGVTQSGLGTKKFPLGWGDEQVRAFVLELLEKKPFISSTELSKAIVSMALKNDVYKAKDDITCGSIYFREPRKLLIATGPPFNPERDIYLADLIKNFNGRTILCGGTTAQIISRELKRSVSVRLSDYNHNLPPESTIEGIDLVTEGIITLGKVSEYLTKENLEGNPRGNPAEKILWHILNSDIIHFVIGTRINEAHQDPNMPVELEIRRNIVKKIGNLIKEKYLKEVQFSFI